MDNLQIGSGGCAGKALVAIGSLTPKKVNDWVAEAQPGARICYFSGWSFASEGDERLGVHLRSLEKQGFIFMVMSKPGLAGRDHLIIRSSRPAAVHPQFGLHGVSEPRRPLALHEQAREFGARGGR